MGGSARHSVVVTGVGPVTSIGTGSREFWDGIVAGRSGVRALGFQWIRESKFRCRVGAPVEDPDPEKCSITAREANLLDPAARLALAGATLALEDAGFRREGIGPPKNTYRIEGVDPRRAGVVLGTGIGGLCTIESAHGRWNTGVPLNGSHRYALPMLIPNAIPAQVSIRFGLRGECKAVVTACAAGTMALGDAFRLVRDGELDVVLSGGVDKTLSTVDGFGLIGFDLLKTLSTRNEEPERASRPFDADRDGFVLGEGAGVLVLEREEHARARGARCYARILGYGTSSDAHSMMQLESSGDEMVRCMEQAIRSAGIGREDVVYVNAHGTATRQNDPQEAGALRRVFGSHIGNVLVNSTKAMVGHGIGAAGGIEAITTALSLARGLIHRCVNLEKPDPECEVELPRENRFIRPVAALTNSFGFGGHNSTLVMGSA